MEAVTEVFKTEWFSIDAVPQKNQKPYYRLSCNDSVVTLALTADQQLINIRQYRPAINSFMLEWPAGLVDDGETSAQAAQRELLEETGYQCDSLEFVGTFRALPCRVNSSIHLFFGKGAKKTAGQVNADGIELILTAKDEFDKLLLKSGESFSIATIGFYHFVRIKALL